MRLLKKINRSYLRGSAIILTVALVVLYVVITSILRYALVEGLYQMEQLVQRQIETKNDLISVFPLVEVEECAVIKQDTLSTVTIFDPIEGEDEDYLELQSYHEINGNIFHITVRASAVEKEQIAIIFFIAMAGIIILIMSLLFLANKRISRTVWYPFYKNLQLIRAFSVKENRTVPLEETGITEFDELNDEVHKLTRKVIDDYNNLRQFTENASHEIQTPLSVIRAKLETLINKGELPEAQMKLVFSIIDAVNRLTNTNKSLLLLTKIDNRQFTENTEVNFDELVKNSIQSFSELIELNHLTLTVIYGQSVRYTMDKNLAEILINNLLGNSIKHNLPDGRIHIEINGNKITFYNSGTKEIEHSHRIFERFYKADSSSKSAGLGLAIVKSICGTSNIGVTYKFSEGMHAFTLLF